MVQLKFNAIYQEVYYYWHNEIERKTILKFILNPEIYIGVQLFQFTGVEDKDEREIFGGDIIRFTTYVGEIAQGEVYFESGSFKVDTILNKDIGEIVETFDLGDGERVSEIKVIGHSSQKEEKIESIQ